MAKFQIYNFKNQISIQSDHKNDQDEPKMSIADKFKSKKDLHTYMSQHRKCSYDLFRFNSVCLVGLWLPTAVTCRLSFLQAILMDMKKSLQSCAVDARPIKNSWPELAVKNVWPMVKDAPGLRDYLPSDEMEHGRFPDKIFFWGILFSVHSSWANEFHLSVLKLHTGMPKPSKMVRQVPIADHWIDNLL